MFEYLIPNALAQGATKASEADSTGTLGGIILYIWTHLDNWIMGLVVLFIFYMIGKALSKSTTNYLMKARGESMPENALVLVDRLVKIAIISIGIVIAGSLNGIELGVVLGAIGFGFGFALKDIIGNMIASVMMLAQKHVSIGDLVEVAGTTGTISSIDTRVTVLQSLEGHKIIIPNQQMINEKITSYTSNPFRRLEIFTYISWDSDLEKGMAVVREVLNQYSEIAKEPEPSVLLDNIEDESNFAIRVLFWIESSKNWLDIQSNLQHRIITAFMASGIDIAYPVRSLTISQNVHDTLEAVKNIREGKVVDDYVNDFTDEQMMAAAKATKDLYVPSRLKVNSPSIPIAQNVPVQSSVAKQEIPVAPDAPKIDLEPKELKSQPVVYGPIQEKNIINETISSAPEGSQLDLNPEVESTKSTLPLLIH